MDTRHDGLRTVISRLALTVQCVSARASHSAKHMGSGWSGHGSDIGELPQQQMELLGGPRPFVWLQLEVVLAVSDPETCV